MKSYRELQIWQKAREITKNTYAVTRLFPAQEQYALASQMNRSAVSIVSNIAEGWARGSTKDFLKFLYITRGSIAELETQFTLASDLEYITDETLLMAEQQLTELNKMLAGFITKLKERTHTKLLTPIL